MSHTPEEAKALLCPFARTFIKEGPIALADKGCKGPACALWRWEPISADDPRFVAAKARALEELGGGATRHAAAVARVIANREAYGVPTSPERGFCGAGGKP
jgi:hypothetical protein